MRRTLPACLRGSFARVAGVSLGLTVIALALGCNQPSPNPPPPPFEITITSISNPTPNLNESYQIEWAYSPNNRLDDQFAELQSLTLDGNISQKFFGCPPVEFRPSNLAEPTDCGPQAEALSCPNDQAVFNNQCRLFVGRFSGPVIFSITARDRQTGSWARQSVTLKLPNSYFRASIQTSNDGYPRVALGSGEVKNLEFMKYFAIYHDDSRNALVEELSVPPFNAVFAPGEPFFARSSRVEESQRFGFRLGSSFPVLDPGFLATNAGRPYVGVRTHADGLVFAGTIALDGTAETLPVKTANGEAKVTVVTQLPTTVTQNGVSKRFFPQELLFIQVDWVSALTPSVPALAGMVAANVKLGNIGQGLVMPTFGGEIGPVTPSLASDATITLFRGTPDNPVGFSNGDMAAAGVALQLTTRSGALLLPASAQLTAVSWRNVPAFSDDRLELLLTGD